MLEGKYKEYFYKKMFPVINSHNYKRKVFWFPKFLKCQTFEFYKDCHRISIRDLDLQRKFEILKNFKRSISSIFINFGFIHLNILKTTLQSLQSPESTLRHILIFD